MNATAIEKQKRILIVSKRLLWFTAGSLVILSVLFAMTYVFDLRFPMSPFCFECGIIGGFVSIQQRLKKVNDDELRLLSESWTTILVIPIFGGVFALVLYILFLSGLIEGHLFPQFSIPPFTDTPTTQDMRNFFLLTYPASPQDFAKFAFWSFVSGFSERFVPQIIHKVSDRDAEN